MSTIPAAIEILNFYLYGQKNTPTSNELDNEKFIRDKDATSDASINANEYMSIGAGRFMTPEKFEIIRRFFSGEGDFSPGEYTKTQAAMEILGPDPKDVSRPRYYGETIYQYGLGVNESDFKDRAFVFGTTGFQLSDDPNLKFIIKDDGARKIVNFSAIPKPKIENFDFTTDTAIANIFNFITKDAIDPSLIGRVVKFNFYGDSSNKTTLTKDIIDNLLTKNAVENALVTKIALLNPDEIATMFGSALLSLSKDIISSGAISYKDSEVDSFIMTVPTKTIMVFFQRIMLLIQLEIQVDYGLPQPTMALR